MKDQFELLLVDDKKGKPQSFEVHLRKKIAWGYHEVAVGYGSNEQEAKEDLLRTLGEEHTEIRKAIDFVQQP